MPIVKTGPLPYLTDVKDGLAPLAGDLLTYDGNEWTAAPTADTGAQALPELEDVADDATSAAADGHVLVFNDADGLWYAVPAPWLALSGGTVTGPLQLDLLTRVGADTPATGDVLVWVGTEYVPQPVPAASRSSAINFLIDGGGAPITPGIKGDLKIEQSGYLTAWVIMADQVGSVTIDIWKDLFSSYPPTVADSMFTIQAQTKPNLANAIKNESGLPGTFVVQPNDILRFNVDAATTVTRLTFELRLQDAL